MSNSNYVGLQQKFICFYPRNIFVEETNMIPFRKSSPDFLKTISTNFLNKSCIQKFFEEFFFTISLEILPDFFLQEFLLKAYQEVSQKQLHGFFFANSSGGCFEKLLQIFFSDYYKFKICFRNFSKISFRNVLRILLGYFKTSGNISKDFLNNFYLNKFIPLQNTLAILSENFQNFHNKIFHNSEIDLSFPSELYL